MTDLDLDAIEARAARVKQGPLTGPRCSDAMSLARTDVPALVAALREARTEVRSLREANESLGGMVEWQAEVIIDTRDALRVGGCTEHVLTAEQAGALEAATRILNRERNANPSRYDEAHAAIAAVRALCDHADSGLHAGLTMVSVAAVRGAILAALDVRHDPSATTEGAS